jgi:hypothetical protein
MTPQLGERSGVPAKAGRITAVMRALAADGPQHLRIARVESGRIIGERIFDPKRAVTIGASERATFVVVDAPYARRRVFQFKKGRWFHDELPLEASARGKFRVGSATFLFQLVVPPPARAKPALPLGVLTNPLSVDLRTCVVAGLSFLLHFLLAGAIYSDWLDPIADEGLVVNGVADMMKSLPPPPVIESPAEEVAVASTPSPEPKKGGDKGTKGNAQSKPNGNAGLVAALEQIELATLGLRHGGPATEGVLDRGEIPTAALDEAAKSDRGVSNGPGLVLRGGGPLVPGTQGSLVDLGRRTKSDDGRGAGETTKVRGPRGDATISAPPTTRGVPGAEAAVYGMRAGIRQCYMRGLEKYPDAEGGVRLALHVGPNGEVQNVIASSSGLPGEIVSCIANRARAAQFGEPEGGSAVVTVPIQLRKQK